MKYIIAGSRGITDYEYLDRVMKERVLPMIRALCEKVGEKHAITEIVSGGARGVDSLGERWALENGMALKVFPAQWDKYGRKAGPLRNLEMAKYADALIAIWDGESRGTKHMIDSMTALGKPVTVINIDEK